MTRRRLAVLAVLALPALVPAVAAAHEIGTTRISIAINTEHRYRVEIVTDAQALADRMAGESKQAPASVFGARGATRAVAGFDELFVRRATLTFDGAVVHPVVTYTVTSAAPGRAPVVTVQLTGPAPAGAQVLQWTYGWTYASYALTVQRAADPQPTSVWLEGGQPSALIALGGPAAPVSRSRVAVRYLVLGFTHIVPYGLDHMLFVVSLYLLTRGFRPLLMQVSAFTVAHSITLGLGMFGVVSVRPSVVEPLIAISIAYVALENIVVSELKPWRILVVFGFGLLHGLGFAGALRELGLPRGEFVTALVTFNLGVEAGQLAVIGTAFLLVGYWFDRRPWFRQRIVVPASAVIACAAVFWTFQRLRL